MIKSPVEEARIKYQPELPKCLHNLSTLEIVKGGQTESIADQDEIKYLFNKSYGQPILHFKEWEEKEHRPLRVGVVFSGGQAAGGHNVVTALFDALKKMHFDSKLFGFLQGPLGIIENNSIELTKEILDNVRNTGGFDLIGSGRTKIETTTQLEASKKSVEALNLDGLVIIGGDDSNTNAAFLAEYFLTHQCKTKVIGVPKTIDGDLKNDFVEISFGFDSACKTYSEMIGNIAKDAISAKKYTHFIKLMGRSASHITLECALQTHPNIALIGEEIFFKQMTLKQITEEIASVLKKRSQQGKNYAVVLIPEGLIEFVPEIKQLISELNTLLAKQVQDVVSKLSEQARKTFKFLPKEIADQLLFDRDPHGNVQVSHIATEQLFIHTVKNQLEGKLSFVNHFFGYEGRSCFPSNFDATYCYALGVTAALLIDAGCTGYMSVVRNLAKQVSEWEVGGIPITMLMNMEERKGKRKAVIRKTLVDLESPLFKTFVENRQSWALEDHYRMPGPIQLFGPKEICDMRNFTLRSGSLLQPL